MIIIGLSGKYHSGKDSLYEIARELIQQPCHKIAFADALKDEVCDACKVAREYLEYNKHIFRPILQWWGTDFRRNLSTQNYWVYKVLQQLAHEDYKNSIVFITDVRFVNEAEMIQQVGGLLIRINRPSIESKDDHLSETALDNYKFDFTVLNAGDLSNLRETVRDLLTLINKRYTPKDRMKLNALCPTKQ